MANARPGEMEWVEAGEYISKNYSGTVRARLLATLRRAEEGLPGFDGSIKATRDGVIPRALGDGMDRGKYQAEVRLRRAL